MPEPTRKPRVRKVDTKGRVNVTYWLPEEMVDRLAKIADDKAVHPQILIARAVDAWLDDLLPQDVAVYTRTDLRRAAAGLDHPNVLLALDAEEGRWDGTTEAEHPVVAHLAIVHDIMCDTFEEANRVHNEIHSDPTLIHVHERMDYRTA